MWREWDVARMVSREIGRDNGNGKQIYGLSRDLLMTYQ